jgi:large subunit ribosomal protein L11
MSYRGTGLIIFIATVNLRVLAGVAKPNPKMGQALGPLGINMMKFCE